MTVIEPGRPYPPGATVQEKGVNFSLFSEHAERVELCVFDDKGMRELARHEMSGPTHQMWHAFLPQAAEGLVYGYRVYGPYQPDRGHRFNPGKLLLDPYAKAWVGELEWHDAIFGYQRGHADGTDSFDARDSARYVPKSVVVKDRSPVAQLGDEARKPFSETVVLEASVKGFSQLYPGLSEDERGRYSALKNPLLLDHLTQLGVSAVEWLPVHAGIDDDFLVQKGLTNYWGYNTLSFFAPTQRFAQNDAIDECRSMVKALHERGIECWLDVVYNHTAEGNETGPTLCYRGLDNASYYRLTENKTNYLNESGCGNTLNLSHPRVLQMVTDSLRYWVSAFGIDGFRFDLASILGRNPHEFDDRSAFFSSLRQDPELQSTHLIAEPWDIGPGGYQLGSFPPGWSEWNDRYRDGVRRFWANETGTLAPLADLLLGSYQSFFANQRTPQASVNFVTAHDGFTLNDLVSYQEKHNEDNREDNRDGHGANHSYNHGVEGATDDEEILADRDQAQRNILATLMLSQGVPMLLAGDEVQNSQGGNNNAYCQDSPVGWIQWPKKPAEHTQFRFLQHLIKLRQTVSLLRQTHWMHGNKRDSHWGLADVSWLSETGEILTAEQWGDRYRQVLLMLMVGVDSSTGQPLALLTGINNSDRRLKVPLDTACLPTGRWSRIMDTAVPGCTDEPLPKDLRFDISPKSVSLLRCYT